ncbi:MAG TPA: MXAN_5187 family protein [Kofleriaceae bacterium]|nr:MXAN_5187 family protein [Kofleriaceae bacterium]
MFWSKIWFFLVAVVAGVTLTLALVMPRPAERATLVAETKRLAHACSITEILLRDFAQSRIQLAGETARVQGVDRVLLEASRGEIVAGASYSTAKKILADELSFGTKRKGDQVVPYRPDLILALDARGRVVARSGKDEKLYGDSLAGYYLVDDALDGYLGDDLWILGGQLFLVAAAPVITATDLDWAGAMVIGEAVDKEFATELADKLQVKLTFYAAGEAVATSDAAQLHEEVLARAPQLLKRPAGSDCLAQQAVSLSAGDTSYWVMLARLPGEAGALGAFYSVHIPQEKAIGFAGTIKAVTKNDLSFSYFPWFRVAIVFLLMVGVGLALMVFEADQPLRRLSSDVVRLAKGDSERLAEDRHRGKFGSIARSVNIALDKLHRETRSAKRDLDQLLGPLPEDQERAAPARSPVVPASDLGAAFTPPPPPPPPSEFRFTDGMRAVGPVALQPGPVPAARNAGPASMGAFDAGAAAHGSPPVAAPTDDRVPPPPVSLPQTGKRPTGASRAPTPRPPVPRGRMATPPGAAPAPEGSGAGHSPHEEFPAASQSVTGRTQQISIEDEDEEDTVVAGRGGSAAALAAAGAISAGDDGTYRPIFDEFVALKRRCGESIDNLTFDRFLAKLRSNRDALIAKHGCRTVKFQVYVKDGKAALKASPVR